MKKINLSKLAASFAAFQNCIKSNNQEWKNRHEDTINEMLENLPHGSGLDGKMQLDWDNSTSEKLVFYFEFHHMDNNGYYCGWTEHNLTVTPSFKFGYDMRISGKDKNQIKEYLYQLFGEVFTVTEETQLA